MNSAPKGFAASRPEVLPVLQRVEVMQWGWVVECFGTEAEMVAAGLCLLRDLRVPDQLYIPASADIPRFTRASHMHRPLPISRASQQLLICNRRLYIHIESC